MKNIIKISSIFFFLILLSNCTAVKNSSEKTINFNGFEMTVPANWEKTEMQGIDSKVGGLKMGMNEEIQYDYGFYANNLSDLEKDNEVIYEKIDGQDAKLIFTKDNDANDVGIYFDDVQSVKNGSMKMHLQMSGKNISRANKESLLKAFRTLKFKK